MWRKQQSLAEQKEELNCLQPANLMGLSWMPLSVEGGFVEWIGMGMARQFLKLGAERCREGSGNTDTA